MGDALHILGHLALAVQRLPPLGLVHHLAHVHFDLTAILAGAVESGRGSCVGKEEGSGEADGAGHAHDGCKAALAYERGRDALPVQHQTGGEGADCGSGEPVGGAGVSNDAGEVSLHTVSICAGEEEGRRGRTGRCR